MRHSKKLKNRQAKVGSRHYDWDIRLIDYIREIQKKPFTWGEHDCLTFANNCVKVQCGEGFADADLGNYKTAKGAASAYSRWLKKSEKASVIEGLDALFERCVGLPPRGAIVAQPNPDGAVLPYAFGIMLNHKAAFVTDTGLVMLVPDSTYLAWRLP